MIAGFDVPTLQGVCNALAATGDGLTGAALEMNLQRCGIDHQPVNVFPNKRTMLYDALWKRQLRDRCANQVVAFIELCLAPAQFTTDHDRFNTLRDAVNQVLLLVGLHVAESGKVATTTAASSLDEAATRANKVRAKLKAMGIHSAVVDSCRRELFRDRNYFHSVLEAAKSVSDRLRKMSGCITDGAELVDEALAKGQKAFPILCLNTYRTPSEQSEQKGLCSLAKALVQLYRNPKAHDLKVVRDIDEENALMAFQMASMVHRLLDRCSDSRAAMFAMQAVSNGTTSP